MLTLLQPPIRRQNINNSQIINDVHLFVAVICRLETSFVLVEEKVIAVLSGVGLLRGCVGRGLMVQVGRLRRLRLVERMRWMWWCLECRVGLLRKSIPIPIPTRICVAHTLGARTWTRALGVGRRRRGNSLH